MTTDHTILQYTTQQVIKALYRTQLHKQNNKQCQNEYTIQQQKYQSERFF